jgi:hypothetical protein
VRKTTIDAARQVVLRFDDEKKLDVVEHPLDLGE